MNLEQIFKQANDCSAPALALRGDQVFGAVILHLTGWRIGDGVWVRIAERDERIPFTHEMLAGMMTRYGWYMPGRPVKQPGMAFIWSLAPLGEVPPALSYNSYSADVDQAERRRMMAIARL